MCGYVVEDNFFWGGAVRDRVVMQWQSNVVLPSIVPWLGVFLCQGGVHQVCVPQPHMTVVRSRRTPTAKLARAQSDVGARQVGAPSVSTDLVSLSALGALLPGCLATLLMVLTALCPEALTGIQECRQRIGLQGFFMSGPPCLLWSPCSKHFVACVECTVHLCISMTADRGKISKICARTTPVPSPPWTVAPPTPQPPCDTYLRALPYSSLPVSQPFYLISQAGHSFSHVFCAPMRPYSQRLPETRGVRPLPTIRHFARCLSPTHVVSP